VPRLMYPSSTTQHIRQIYNRQRPATSNQQTHDILNSYYHQNHGKLQFKENADQQIPNIRYMSPISQQFQQKGPTPMTNIEVRTTTTRSLSAQSLNLRKPTWKIDESQLIGQLPHLSTHTFE
jgi:hypothetical protein